MLEEVIASHFDYPEISKRALAARWIPLTAGERAEFVELFKSFLSDRYANEAPSSKLLVILRNSPEASTLLRRCYGGFSSPCLLRLRSRFGCEGRAFPQQATGYSAKENKIEGYPGEQVFYLSERIEGNYAEVRTELRSLVLVPIDAMAVVAQALPV